MKYETYGAELFSENLKCLPNCKNKNELETSTARYLREFGETAELRHDVLISIYKQGGIAKSEVLKNQRELTDGVIAKAYSVVNQYNVATGITRTDMQRNEIAKDLRSLLPKIDPRVKWVDYIPEAAGLPFSVIAICVGNRVKYVDIYSESHFKMMKRVINAMDDYCFDVQFLTDSKVSMINDTLAEIMERKTMVANWIVGCFNNEDIDISVFRQITRVLLPGTEVEEDQIGKQLYANIWSATCIDLQTCVDLIENSTKEKEMAYEL